ncbi:MAG: histidine phosphatase family protein, partial [Bacteroidales bacterium]|nr:histidine phosphatase family protein [Bacteroidales bacterium]
IRDDRLQLWYADFVHVRATDGESFIDVARRVQSFIDDLTQRFGSKQEIVLFTHGGVITAFQFCVERCSLDLIFDLQVPYGTILSLEIA